MSEYTQSLDALEREFKGGSPYPGLRPFQSDESQFFKGRGIQIREIVRRLAEENCVSVLGGSGCGKSSLIRAGVIPALRRKMIPGSGDLWCVAVFTPGRTPVDNLIKALGSILSGKKSDEIPTSERDEEIREVLYGPDGLGGFLPAFWKELEIDPGVAMEARKSAKLFILIDQFEELFRDENRGLPQTARLIELIINYWKKRHRYSGLFLTLTMRTDDLHRCAEFIDLPDIINATAYLTRRLKEEELKEAIIAPVRPPMFRAGLLQGEPEPGQTDLRPYDVDVIIELLDAVEGISHDPDHLPLLQHLLAVLWRFTLARWKSDADAGKTTPQLRITRDDLAGAVGFENWEFFKKERKRHEQYNRNNDRGWVLKLCLKHIAEALYKGDLFGGLLTNKQQNITRTAFCLMGEIDDRGNFKRRWTDREEIAKVEGLIETDPDISTFLHRFSRDHQLLKITDDGIDVYHEALMRNWRRLGDWLKDDRNAWNAYKELKRNYQKWKNSSPSRLSWFRRKNGYLGPADLDEIEPFLFQKSKRLNIIVPRHNYHWVKRFLLPTQSIKGRSINKTEESQGELSEKEFDNHFDYLKKSIHRNSLIQKLPIFVFFCIAVIAGIFANQHYKLYKQENKLLQEQSKSYATTLWYGLEQWSPIPDREYIGNLWRIALAEDDVLTQFVKQLPKGNHINQLGHRPAPIIRAIGLRWQPEARKIVSDSFKDEFEKKSYANHFTVANLAWGTAALGSRFDKDCHDEAINYFEGYIDKQGQGSKGLFNKGRILACLGASLESDKRNKALTEIFETVNEKVMDYEDYELNDIAPAVTAAAWFKEENIDDLTANDQEVLNRVLGKLTASLKNESTGFYAAIKARSIVSLIVLLDSEYQRRALKEILCFVNEWQDINPDILLILSQAYEIVARQHKSDRKANKTKRFVGDIEELLQMKNCDEVGQPAHRLKRFVDDIKDLLQMQNYSETGRPINKIAVARLAIPLANTVIDCNKFDNLLRDKDIEVESFDKIEERIKGKPEEESKFDNMLIGYIGRSLSLEMNIVNLDIDETLENTKNLLSCLAEDEKSSCLGNFAREGLAHIIGALARGSRLTSGQRKKALSMAKKALAETGSDVEAAAWARAITKLLDDDNKLADVAEIVEILKYPTAGLTSREPNAAEPKNATDIFIGALIKKLEGQNIAGLDKLQEPLSCVDKKTLKEYPFCPGNPKRIIEKIMEDDQFKTISIDKRVKDPRKTDYNQ